MQTLFVIAAKWPPEYGGPGLYYKKHIHHIAQIAERVRIVAWSRGGLIDLEGAPANVSAILLRPWRGRLGRHMSGIRLVWRLLRETRLSTRNGSGVLFTGGTISIGWRPVALCSAALGLPVLVENVLFQADDGRSLTRARWASITRRAATRLKAFCPVSSGLRESIRIAFPEAVAVPLPYGVDLSAYTPPTADRRRLARTSIGMSNDALVAVSFGALHERKGQLPLVDAWLRWIERSRRSDSRLFLVGPPSDSEYVASIHTRIAAATVEAARTVTLAGFSPDTATYLRAADVYLSAACAEGLPISIVEALATGVPVVCRTLDGVTDDFLHGQAVTAIADWNADAVGEAMEALSASEFRAQASRDARAVAEERFDIAKRLAVIKGLLTNSPSSTCPAVS
jgi:glycosyltransferase involved in cell wall biosynthesis